MLPIWRGPATLFKASPRGLTPTGAVRLTDPRPTDVKTKKSFGHGERWRLGIGHPPLLSSERDR